MSKTPKLDEYQSKIKEVKQELTEHKNACESWKTAMTILIKHFKTMSRNTNVKKIFVNEAKKTVAVKFDNGDVMTATCAEEDTFNAEVGIATAIAEYYCGGKKAYHNLVAKYVK